MTVDVGAVLPRTADVVAITEEVWRSYLGEAEPLLPGPPLGHDADAHTATVSITGAWNGLVTITLPPVAARLVAQRMLGTAEEDPVPAGDVSDVVGELVNMVGGNVKSLMPGPSALSLPVVAAGRVAPATGAAEVCRADLTWAGHPVQVTVHAQAL